MMEPTGATAQLLITLQRVHTQGQCACYHILLVCLDSKCLHALLVVSADCVFVLPSSHHVCNLLEANAKCV
jgi:hypothetical protein